MKSKTTIEQCVATAQPLALDMRSQKAFTVNQILTLTGASARQLQYWQNSGFLTPRDGSESTCRDYTTVCLISRILEGQRQGLCLEDAASYAHAMQVLDRAGAVVEGIPAVDLEQLQQAGLLLAQSQVQMERAHKMMLRAMGG